MEQTVNNRPLGRAKMEVKDLNLFYGDFQALKHVSISMPEKEITAFIGPLRLRKIHPAENTQPHERPGGGLPH